MFHMVEKLCLLQKNDIKIKRYQKIEGKIAISAENKSAYI